MKEINKVVHYLKNTMYWDWIYSNHFKDKKETKAFITFFLFRLIWYGDNSYVENLEDKKSLIRYCYFINEAVVSWYSKKEKTILTFTIEAKYIVFKHIV